MDGALFRVDISTTYDEQEQYETWAEFVLLNPTFSNISMAN